MADQQVCIEVKNFNLQAEDGSIWSQVELTVPCAKIIMLHGLTQAARRILLRRMAGLSPFSSGQLSLWGKSLQEISRYWLTAHVRFISSADKPGFSFPVRDYIRRGCDWRPDRGQPDARQVERQVQQLIDVLELEPLCRRDCNLLGRSDLLRVNLAQALMCQPSLLLLDDPLDQIMPEARRLVMDLLMELATAGKTIVLTCDDPVACATEGIEPVDLDQQAVQERLADKKLVSATDKESEHILF